MDKKKLWPLLILLLALVVALPVFSKSSVLVGAAGLVSEKPFPNPLNSQPAVRPSSIIVNGADSVLDKSFTHSQGLIDTMSLAGPTVIVEYADSTAPHILTGAPSALQTLVIPLPQMVIVEYADSTAPCSLETIPSTLQSVIDNVPTHVIAEYSDSASRVGLAYPFALMNDSQSPEISEVSVTGNGSITWTTDEFATSAVLYGVQTGVYTETVSDPLYVKQHTVSLTGLTPGAVYYYQTRSTDRSGNTTTSSEYTFTAPVWVYLPVVVRNH